MKKGSKMGREGRLKISEAGRGNQNALGYKHTDDARLKMSITRMGRRLSEATKKKISDAEKGRSFSIEHRKKIREALKGHPVSSETRQKISDANKDKHTSPESEFKKGNVPWMKGHHHSAEAKAKISQHHLGTHYALGHHPSEAAKRIMREAALNYKLTDEQKKKISEALKGNHNTLGHKLTDEHRRKVGEASKRMWQDKEYHDRVIHAQRNGMKVKPNKREQQLGSLLNSLFPNEFRFVGDGQFILDGLCPDFVNVNGKKQIIELFGQYWHDEAEVPVRIERFAKFGYSTLIIWENELMNVESLKMKIISFIK